MRGLEELLLTAHAFELFLWRRGWRFCFIGGVAIQRWGIPRFTQDIDLTLLTGFGQEEMFVDGLLTELKPLLDLKGAPESLSKLERMLAAVERRLTTRP